MLDGNAQDFMSPLHISMEKNTLGKINNENKLNFHYVETAYLKIVIFVMDKYSKQLLR